MTKVSQILLRSLRFSSIPFSPPPALPPCPPPLSSAPHLAPLALLLIDLALLCHLLTALTPPPLTHHHPPFHPYLSPPCHPHLYRPRSLSPQPRLLLTSSHSPHIRRSLYASTTRSQVHVIEPTPFSVFPASCLIFLP